MTGRADPVGPRSGRYRGRVSRLRATLATNKLDRSIQSQVASAERAIRSALQMCLQAGSRQDLRSGHLARVRRDLERCLGALQGVRTVAPRYDTSDPDLAPFRPIDPDLEFPDTSDIDPDIQVDVEPDFEDDI